MGIQEYRKTLTLRKSEVVASQLAQLHHKPVEGGQVVEENSVERNAPVPVAEPVSGWSKADQFSGRCSPCDTGFITVCHRQQQR